MRTDKDLVGILIQETNSEGLITLCQSHGAFFTTASKFAPGCVLTNNDGVVYRNSGTAAVPVWSAIENSIVISNYKKAIYTFNHTLSIFRPPIFV